MLAYWQTSPLHQTQWTMRTPQGSYQLDDYYSRENDNGITQPLELNSAQTILILRSSKPLESRYQIYNSLTSFQKEVANFASQIRCQRQIMQHLTLHIRLSFPMLCLFCSIMQLYTYVLSFRNNVFATISKCYRPIYCEFQIQCIEQQSLFEKH